MSDDSYPFHTGEIDGEECAGVMFVAGTGRFYEFQDPADHDDYERYEDPRTGDVLTHTGPINRALAGVTGGRVKAPVPADEWAEFREEYINAPDDAQRDWAAAWESIHADGLEEMAAEA